MSTTRKHLVDRIDHVFYHLAGWAVNHRTLVVGLCLAMLGASLFFAGRIHSDNSLVAYFDQSDPAYIAYSDYLEEFQSDEVTYILYRVPDRPHGPFNLEAMRQIAQLTEALEEVPFTREVTSLTNVELIRAEGDTINVDELMLDFPETQRELLEMRELVLSRPLYVNYLVNPDASYAAIIMEMDKSSVDPLEEIIHDPQAGTGLDNLYPQASYLKVQEILGRDEYEGIEFFLTGDAPMNAAYNYIFLEDSAIGTVLTLGLLSLVSLLLFRTTLLGLLGPLTVVLLSIVMILGMMGLFGWVLGLFFGIVPTLICAVGVAQSVHIILEYQRSLAATGDRRESVKRAIAKVGGACLLAAVTTALGFLVMSVSELKSLSEMALYASAGVLFTFLLSVTLLVVFLGGKSKGKGDSKFAGNTSPVAPFIIRAVAQARQWNLQYPRRLIVIGFTLLGFSVIGATQLNISFNFLEEFKPHLEWRQDTEKVEEVMGGLLSVAYIIDANEIDGVKSPELLKAIAELQAFAEAQPYVKKTYSIADVQKDLNRSFHGDDTRWYRVPDSRQLIAQYFLVYELSGGEELADFVSSDYASTVFEMRVEMTSSDNLKRLIADVDQYLADNPLPGAQVRKTGIGLMWIKIAEYIADTQLVGYSLIFIGVAVALCFAFGSIKVGLLSMIPNLMPVVVVMGAMGWLGVSLDYMKLLLATIAIGIAVDDTIHLVMRFRRRFLETGRYDTALELSMTDVGPALVITTLILLGAFSCYLISNMQVITSFGILLSAAIVTALYADLLFMPALLMVLKPFGPEFEPAEADADTEPVPVG